MSKPVVQYRSMGFPIFVGGSPLVYALNHPRLGEQDVRTSVVQSVKTDDDGKVVGFETLNTIYELDPHPIDFGH